MPHRTEKEWYRVIDEFFAKLNKLATPEAPKPTTTEAFDAKVDAYYDPRTKEETLFVEWPTDVLERFEALESALMDRRDEVALLMKANNALCDRVEALEKANSPREVEVLHEGVSALTERVRSLEGYAMDHQRRLHGHYSYIRALEDKA